MYFSCFKKFFKVKRFRVKTAQNNTIFHEYIVPADNALEAETSVLAGQEFPNSSDMNIGEEFIRENGTYEIDEYGTDIITKDKK